MSAGQRFTSALAFAAGMVICAALIGDNDWRGTVSVILGYSAACIALR